MFIIFNYSIVLICQISLKLEADPLRGRVETSCRNLSVLTTKFSVWSLFFPGKGQFNHTNGIILFMRSVHVSSYSIFIILSP